MLFKACVAFVCRLRVTEENLNALLKHKLPNEGAGRTCFLISFCWRNLQPLTKIYHFCLVLLKFCPSFSKCEINTDLKVIFDNCSF